MSASPAAPPTLGPSESPPHMTPLDAAVMRQAARENFPVAAWFLPRRVRRDLLNLYGFARLTDDLGDEAAGDRGALLDWLEGELRAVYAGLPTHPAMRRLRATVRRFDLPATPFQRLIQANRQDQTVRRYPTYAELAGYCALSANPVGHLVLYVLGAATPDRIELSDRVCTGLQLVEHWQDVAEDFAMDRVYLPQDELSRFGVSEDDLAARRPSPAFRRLMAFEVARAQALLGEGAPLAATLRGRARIAVAAFVEGGRAALRAIEQADYDVLTQSPRPTRLAKTGAAWRALRTVWQA
ncbi:MAG: squalene synthase HpnC [Actinobacteria bacterium]|nr:squalene synthase HpnC [Actinomycetota bacterium]